MQKKDAVRRRLIKVAKSQKTITYGELMKEFSIPRGHHKRGLGIGCVVGEISKSEHMQGNPMLSAIVVHKGGKTIGRGFFELARELRLLNKKQKEKDFLIQEQQEVWNHQY